MITRCFSGTVTVSGSSSIDFPCADPSAGPFIAVQPPADRAADLFRPALLQIHGERSSAVRAQPFDKHGHRASRPPRRGPLPLFLFMFLPPCRPFVLPQPCLIRGKRPDRRRSSAAPAGGDPGCRILPARSPWHYDTYRFTRFQVNIWAVKGYILPRERFCRRRFRSPSGLPYNFAYHFC
jgi:hypothetical protein